MASFPARESSTLQAAIESIARQVDVVNLCLNQFSEVPEWLVDMDNVNSFIPEVDYKDVGKFIVRADDDDDVFYVDDDILYPRDYVSYGLSVADRYRTLSLAPVIGFHGVIYSDVFDGQPNARNVFSFRTQLAKARVVNQLGTGTAHCKGWQCPDLDFMLGSERFVDVRFALHAYNKGMPLVCAPREAGWMKDLESGQSIFESFTKKWPIKVTREVQDVAGYGKLPLDAVTLVE